MTFSSAQATSAVSDLNLPPDENKSVDMFLLLSKPHISLSSTLEGNTIDNSNFLNYIFNSITRFDVFQLETSDSSVEIQMFSVHLHSLTKHNAVTADGCSASYMIFVNS